MSTTTKTAGFRSEFALHGVPFVVSTIPVRDGRSVRWETAIRANGRTSDPIFSDGKASAGVTHDRVCDIVRGRFGFDAHSRIAHQLLAMGADIHAA